MTDFGGALQKRDDFDFALLGIPYDGKSSYRQGPALGPQAIREAATSAAMNAWTELGVNLETDAVVADLGDVDVSGDYNGIFERIQDSVLSILNKNAVPLIMGGDHSITYPVVKAVAQKYRVLDILHFDAHPDLYAELYGDPFSHACPFARILEQGLASNLVQVGIRAGTGEHQETAKQYRVKVYSMRDLREIPVLEFKHPLYISFDVDVLDPAFAPGVSHCEPGGLTTREALHILQNVKAEIIGMDVVEVNPLFDHAGRTASAAVKIMMETAGLVVSARRSKK
ncbi:MAG: agmatinase [Candidatus Aminicenantes bacterium]|nr:agmatinase [Candidatus Aminicenantes bacterium]